jgi:hypothetical protein
MSIKMKVLRVMADGKPRSAKDVIAETGLQPRQAESAVRALATCGMAESTPVMYQLNARGLERANFKAKTPAQRKAEYMARQKESLKRPTSAAKVVARAKESRDPLSSAWGSFATEAASA